VDLIGPNPPEQWKLKNSSPKLRREQRRKQDDEHSDRQPTTASEVKIATNPLPRKPEHQSTECEIKHQHQRKPEPADGK